MVNPFTGELDTKNAFPNWDSKEKHLFELFSFIKRVIRQADEYIEHVGSLLRNAWRQRQDSDTSTAQGELNQNNTPDRSQIHEAPSERKARETASKIHIDCQPDDFDASLRNLFTWFHYTLDFFKTYDNCFEDFDRRLNEFKDKCEQQKFDRPAICGDDRNAIVFSSWDSVIHEPLRSCVLAGRFTPTRLFASYHKETDSVSFIPGHDVVDDG